MAEVEERLVLIGGSAGSVDAVMRLIPALDQKFAIPVLLVLHRAASSPENFLADILQPRSHLRIKEAEEKEVLRPGTVYIAPADYHLLLEQDHTFSLDMSEKVNYSRPSIDVSMESAALHYGHRLTAILLTGANADGAQGMRQVLRHGGHTIAQAPETAEVAYMPQAAINAGAAQQVLSVPEIASYLNSLAK